MKQKDLALIFVSVFVAGIFSYIICSKFISTPQNDRIKAEVVTPITSEFNLPDKLIFNPEAINPTKMIEIGPNSNNQPFANN